MVKVENDINEKKHKKNNNIFKIHKIKETLVIKLKKFMRKG